MDMKCEHVFIIRKKTSPRDIQFCFSVKRLLDHPIYIKKLLNKIYKSARIPTLIVFSGTAFKFKGIPGYKFLIIE